MKLLRVSLRSRLFIPALIVVVVLIAAFATTAAAFGSNPPPENAKNVIIMIADGSGFNQYLLADYYENGRAGKQPYEKFPVKFGVATTPLQSDGTYVPYDPAQAWANFTYVSSAMYGKSGSITESDMAATAIATGYKTSKGVGWVSPASVSTAGSQQNILEYAETLGKSTGVVTSKFFDDATPAGFVAHKDNRDLYWTIADQMINLSAVDVIMGSGNPYFDNSGQPVNPSDWGDYTYSSSKPPYYLSQATYDALVAGTAGGDANGDGTADPWTFVQTRNDFQKLAKGNTPARVFGLTQSAKTTQALRGGDVLANPYVVPFNANVPTLAEMASGALNVLDNDPDGFVVMIEGGAIDDASHEGYAGRIIEEFGAFDDTVNTVLDWIDKNGGWDKNLLIVTADHETGYIWGPGSGYGLGDPTKVAAPADGVPDPNWWRPVINNGKKALPGFTWNYVDSHYKFWHTNSLVPLWANGAGIGAFDALTTNTDLVRGAYIENTDIFTVMKEAITP
jgi:alkaline phosphatase